MDEEYKNLIESQLHLADAAVAADEFVHMLEEIACVEVLPPADDDDNTDLFADCCFTAHELSLNDDVSTIADDATSDSDLSEFSDDDHIGDMERVMSSSSNIYEFAFENKAYSVNEDTIYTDSKMRTFHATLDFIKGVDVSSSV